MLKNKELLVILVITTYLKKCQAGPEVIKLEFIFKLKIKRNGWLFADMCPQVANHCALF